MTADSDLPRSGPPDGGVGPDDDGRTRVGEPSYGAAYDRSEPVARGTDDPAAGTGTFAQPVTGPVTPADGEDPPTSSAGRGRGGRDGRRGGRRSFLRELPVLVILAFVLALLIKAFLIQAFWIPSASMERTLLVNDRVLVNKVVYRFRDVHRGEIVVFNGDGTGFAKAEAVVAPPSNIFQRGLRDVQDFLGLGAPSDKDFIKRVIAVGGDRVACCDAQGRVTVNGRALDEPYIYNSGAGVSPEFPAQTVAKGDLWVMGDHRDGSSDSRANGEIPESKVVGRAFVRVWPVSRFGFLSVPRTFSDVPAALASAPLVPAVALVAPLGFVRHRRRRRATGPRPSVGAGRGPG